MIDEKNTYQVAIIGGGPVGLFLACCLQHTGISCIVLEKRAKPITHSRSIGIHPVSLELFKKIGLANSFISEGIKVKRGFAFINDDHTGTISFQSCPPPYRFILTLPQYKTERLLSLHLNKLAPSILHRNSTVTAVTESNEYIGLEISSHGREKQISARYVVGCDGRNSFIRQASGISFTGKIYDDTYIMGDFSDNTSFGNAAAIFITHEGLIESFPLSKTMRRWVVKTNQYITKPERIDIETRISRRINHDLSNTKNRMTSSFGVQKKLAETMTLNRIILAGDAAHIISPIGGQGMNLGWLDAWDLSHCLKQILVDRIKQRELLNKYSTRRLRIARKAARRALFNMALGRKTPHLLFKKTLLASLLKTPVSGLMANLFTMRGLRSYPF